MKMKSVKQGAVQYRQGDVLVVELADGIPLDAKPVAREDGRVILARGEATGHHHSFGSRLVNMYAVAEPLMSPSGGLIGDVRALVVKGKGATLRHQEHAPITHQPRRYGVIIQREFHDEQIRNVAD